MPLCCSSFSANKRQPGQSADFPPRSQLLMAGRTLSDMQSSEALEALGLRSESKAPTAKLRACDR